MTSLREFTRSLGVSADAIKTDKELYEFMKLYDPQTKKRTGIRVLSNYVINEIDADGNFKTLTELFGVLNSDDSSNSISGNEIGKVVVLLLTLLLIFDC